MYLNTFRLYIYQIKILPFFHFVQIIHSLIMYDYWYRYLYSSIIFSLYISFTIVLIIWFWFSTVFAISLATCVIYFLSCGWFCVWQKLQSWLLSNYENPFYSKFYFLYDSLSRNSKYDESAVLKLTLQNLTYCLICMNDTLPFVFFYPFNMMIEFYDESIIYCLSNQVIQI